LADYPPQRVSDITGIAADDVVKLARLYATSQPSMIRIGVAIERHAGAGQAVRAITCLPALTGAWRHVGGGILQITVWAFPVNGAQMHRPDWIAPGTRVLNQWQLGRALTGELALDPPIKALFVYNANPAVVASDQRKVLAGLARDDLFCVVGEQFLTDTARYADIVLPNTTHAEQLDIVFSWGQMYLTLNLPAVAPLGEAVPNREMFARLALRMGFDDPLFRMTDEEAIRDLVLDWSHPALEGITFDTLRETGWARLSIPPPSQYAPHAEGGFPTPSGKCELYSSLAEAAGDYVIPVFREGYEASQPGTPLDPLPAYVEPERDARFPLTLLSPKAHGFLNSQYGNADRQLRLMGGCQEVVVHADDASARDVSDGQMVTVWNDRGRLRARARISEDVARGVAVCALGYWLGSDPDCATVNAVTSTAYADMGRAPTFSDTTVEIAASQPVEPTSRATGPLTA
jgi:anaerobic selenocysteine-containing dehydrogenase